MNCELILMLSLPRLAHHQRPPKRENAADQTRLSVATLHTKKPTARMTAETAFWNRDGERQTLGQELMI